jgi:hypothetical protein
MNLIQSVVLRLATTVVYALSSVGRAAFFSLILAAAFPVFAQSASPAPDKSPTGSLHGTISTKQENVGSDLSGISVKLTTVPPAGDSLNTDTDDAGHYEFKNLKAGTYLVSITQQGF